MRKSNYEVLVLVNGKPVDEYFHDDSKIYIEGKQKSEFSIKIKNYNSAKVLVVPTVDGLSVMDGKPASIKSRGYVVGGRDTLVVDGWRTSDKGVAKFFFTNPENSYAEFSEGAENIGVIGVAVFEERQSPPAAYYPYEKWGPVVIKEYPHYPPWTPWRSPSWYCIDPAHSTTFNVAGIGGTLPLSSGLDCSATASANAGSFVQGVGTGFGEEKSSPVTTVTFDREDEPSAVFQFFYNTREQLQKMGVLFKKPVYVTPSAFPADNGYCKPPPQAAPK